MDKIIKLDVPRVDIHPIRITEGWKVNYNNFREIDPRNLGPDDDSWFLLTDSLLQLHHERSSITLDLGWYPDISPDGNYVVQIIKDKDWDNPLQEFSSVEYRKVIEFIESNLNQITSSWWRKD